MVGISGVAVCLCPYPCSCLHFWQVCCFAAEVEPDAHAPLPVSAATVAAAGRVFVRPAEAAVAASAVVAVLSVGVVAAWPHRHSAAGFSAAVVVAADTALLDLLIFLILFLLQTAGSVPGASVPVAGSRCWPGAKWEDGSRYTFGFALGFAFGLALVFGLTFVFGFALVFAGRLLFTGAFTFGLAFGLTFAFGFTLAFAGRLLFTGAFTFGLAFG